MSFDYEKFEHDLFVAVEEYAKSKLDHKDDIYIMAIEYWPDMRTFVAIRANTYSYLEKQAEKDSEDYTYYKYCEEEWDWDIFGSFDEISDELEAEYNEMKKMFSDDKYDKLYDCQKEHEAKIINGCKNVMRKLKETDTYKKYPKLYLNVYVREYFSNEEIIQIFGELNGEESIEEYSDWL